jgi:hypothetical protein
MRHSTFLRAIGCTFSATPQFNFTNTITFASTPRPLHHHHHRRYLLPPANTRPRGALGGVVRPTNTCREPSSFEIPSSSAPPALNQPQERLDIVPSRLIWLENSHHDLYEPGTQRERAYMQSMSSKFIRQIL